MPIFAENADPTRQNAPLSMGRAPLGSDAPPAPQFAPDFLEETVPAAMRQNNWIASVAGAMDTWASQSDANKFDPNHNPFETIKGTPFENRPELFLGSSNETETRSIMARATREDQDRRTLAAAGVPGIAASMAAGLLDPTLLIPMVGVGGGALKSALKVGAIGALQAGVSEGALYASQVTRTPEEAWRGIASAAALQGIFGGAIGHLTAAERVGVERALDDMRRPAMGAVPEPSLSAAAAHTRAMQQVKTGIPGLLDRLAPVGRVLGGESAPAKRLFTELVETGRRMEGEAEGVTKTQFGGAVETVNKLEQRKMEWANRSILENAWKEHYYPQGQPGRLQSAYDLQFGKTADGRMSFADFKSAVYEAAFSGDQHANELVSRAAADIRKEILEPLAERAKTTTLADGKPLLDPDAVTPKGDQSFVPRIWQKAKIIAQRIDFRNKISDWLKSEQTTKAATKERLSGLNDRHGELEKHIGKLEGRLETLQGKMQETSARLDERAMEAKAAVKREGSLEQRAGDIRDAISELEEFIGSMRGELRDPAALERLNDLEKEVASLRKEAKPISEAELARLEKEEVGQAFYGPVRKAAEIAIGKRKMPEVPSLTAWMAREGGIFDAGGDVKSILGGKKIPGLLRKERDLFGNYGGRGLDDWAEKIYNDFPEHFPEGRPSPNEVLNWIAEADAGHPPAWWKGEERLQLERDVENLQETFGMLGVEPKSLRAAAEALRGGDPLILQRLMEKAQAGAQLPHAEAALGGRQAARSELADFVERALNDRAKREAALGREGARASEAGVAANRSRGRVKLLEDRAARQELMQDMLANAKQFAEKMRDDVRADIEKEVRGWKGNSSAEAIAALEARDVAQAAAERGAVMGRRSEPGRLKSADKPVDRAVKMILNSDRDLSDLELRDRAEQVIDRILGTPDGRFDYDVASPSGLWARNASDEAKRGSLHSRDFAIPTALVKDFVETDMEHVISAHLRTMLPDLELARRFQSLDLEPQMKAIAEDYNKKIAALETSKLTPAQREKEAIRLQNAKDSDIADLAAMRDRVRNVYGWTGDQTGRWAANVARDLRNWTSLASLGGAAVNSFTDFGVQSVFRYGLNTTFREQWAPFVSSLIGLSKTNAIAKQQAREMGIGVETALGLARHRFEDIASNYRPGNAFSRAVSYAADRMHLVNMLGPWTDMAKTAAWVPAQAEFGRAAARIAAGKGTPKDIARMADASIPLPVARRIAAQIEKHGITEGGVRFANAGKWDDAEARRIFETAMHREVDILVISPGMGEKPLWLSTPAGSVIGQFKTFLAGAHERALIANLQQRDAQTLQGVLAALAMGAMSYGLYSIGSGKMPSERPQDWIKEAIDRAALMGWFGELNKLSAKVSSGRLDVFRAIGADRPLTRRSNNSTLAEFLGPSYSLMEGLGTASSHAWQGEFDGSDMHRLRKTLPMQNLTGFRALLDQVEAGSAHAFGVKPSSSVHPIWEP